MSRCIMKESGDDYVKNIIYRYSNTKIKKKQMD